MPIYKYFTNEAHALALINKGELMIQPLSHFRGLEADGVRGDPLDGILNHAPKDGLVLTMADGRNITLKDGSFNSSANGDGIFVYCASNQLSPDLAKEFGSFCVEISDPEVLVRRLESRKHPTSQFDYEQIVWGKVDYREQSVEPGADWALPEKLVLIKPTALAWQDEFRIALGKRGAICVENVGLTIQKGKAAPTFEPVPPPIFLRIKALKDYAILHRFDTTE